jgi:hypothetical protein
MNMEPMTIVMEDVFRPSTFQQAVAQSLAQTSIAASASSAAVEQVGGSDTLFYILMILILLTALGLATYLIMEHGREQRELQAQYAA